MRTTQKQKGLAHCWKAHGAGHIPLCGIFWFYFQFKLRDGTEKLLPEESLYISQIIPYGMKIIK